MSELVCPTHGPYDASYGTCPYCSGSANRPPGPDPLGGIEDAPTELGYGIDPGFEDDSTQLGQGYHGGGGLVDEIDETQLGKRARRDDVTELDYEFVEAGMLGILWVSGGDRRGQIHRIKDGAIIGRTDGDVILDDPKTSNPHARFRLNEEEDSFVLWDFGSKNGSFVNGERIKAAVELKENDVIKIGDAEMVLKILL